MARIAINRSFRSKFIARPPWSGLGGISTLRQRTDQSASYVFLVPLAVSLSLQERGDLIAQLREHRGRVTLALDRRFKIRYLLIQCVIVGIIAHITQRPGTIEFIPRSLQERQCHVLVLPLRIRGSDGRLGES